MNKYTTIKGGKNFTKGKNDYLRICEVLQKPFIVIESRGNKGSVISDYINLQDKYNEILKDNEKMSREFHIHLFNKYKSEKSEFETNGLTCKISRLSLRNSELLAEELFDYVSDLIGKYNG